MTVPHFKIGVRDVPDAEASARSMQSEGRRLSGRYPALTALHFELGASAAQFDARLDLRFPQHQVIVNATASAPDRAMREVVAAAARELVRLEARDPSVGASTHAKAA